MTDLASQYFDDNVRIFTNSPPLRESRYTPGPELEGQLEIASERLPLGKDPSLLALGLGSGPSSRSNSGTASSLLEYIPDRRAKMSASTVPPDKAIAEDVKDVEHRRQKPVVAGPDPPDDLKATAAKAMAVSDGSTQSTAHTSSSAQPAARIDSAHQSSEAVPQISADADVRAHAKDQLDRRTSQGAPIPQSEDSLTNSPTLSKHMLHVENSTVGTLPIVQSSASHDENGAVSRTRKESLPHFKELANLADIATQQATHFDYRSQSTARHHSQSFSSTTSQSPRLPYHPSFSSSAQTSPVTYQAAAARSPPNPTNDTPTQYGSPYPHPLQAYYADRRSSANTDVGPPSHAPSVPSLPSQSSSGESYGNASSSTDGGYSTSHTTPIDGSAPTDGIPRPILPPPPGMALIPAGGFKCDFPGCNAIPFQTQYLLR